MEVNKGAAVQMSGHSMMRSHPVRNFLVHFVEMLLAMAIGMMAAAAIFGFVVSFKGMTWEQGRDAYPQIFLVVMALGMTLPMVGWMRFRGHGWKATNEMSAFMIVPGIVLIVCVSVHALTPGSACGLYCALMAPLTLIPMLLRRREYSQHRHMRNRAEHMAMGN